MEGPARPPLDYGAWRIDAATGTVQPHDTVARNVQPFVESNCDEELFETVFPPTPSPVPSPPPPTPTPTPITAEEAVAAVRFYLASCLPDIAESNITALREPTSGDWRVIEELQDDPDEDRVWRVDGVDATVTPNNRDTSTWDTRQGPNRRGGC